MIFFTLIFLVTTPLHAMSVIPLTPGPWYMAAGLIREAEGQRMWVINEDTGNELLWRIPAGKTFPPLFEACFKVTKNCHLRCEVQFGEIKEVKNGARPFIPRPDGTYTPAGPDDCR